MEINKITQAMNFDKTSLKGRQKIVTNTNFDYGIHKKYWQSLVPNGYKYTMELKELLPEVIKYFNGGETIYDLGKGLYIYGVYGIGKTTIFDITRQYIQMVSRFNPNAYRITSVEKMLGHFKENNNLDVFGFNVKKDDRGYFKEPANVLINEFGTESKYADIKNFGSSFLSEYNAMLMARYEAFTDFNKLTHCTSNFGLDKLSSMYPPEILDRFVEMFNFIELKGNSFRQ